MAAQTSPDKAPTGLSGTRAKVLAALRAAAGPAGADDLAAQLGLHRNTVRFHMEALVTAGLVEEGRQAGGGKGRPRAVFHPTRHGARSGERNYQLMASVLADHLVRTSADPTGAAYEAGRSWGQRLAVTATGRPRRGTSLPAAVEMFQAMGFEPQASPLRRPTLIRLHNCPFREVVDEHQELVCAIHAGLLDGMLASAAGGGAAGGTAPGEPAAAPAAPLRLEPFATPQTCVIHLGTRKERPVAPTAARR